MAPAPPDRRALHLGLAAAGVLLLAGFGLLASGAFRGPRYEKRGPLHCIVDGDTLYTFDAAWRKETLRTADPKTGLRTIVVEKPAPGRLEALRAALLEDLSLKNLDEVPREKQTEMDEIHRLGYF